MTGFRTDFTSSVWNFCRWVADFPPRETSPAAKSEGKRLFFQAIIADIVVQFYPWFNLILFCFKLIHTMSLRARSNLPLLSAVMVASFTLRYEDRLICFVHDSK